MAGLGLLCGLLPPPRGKPGNAHTLLHRPILSSHRQWGQWWGVGVTCATSLATGGWWIKLQPGRGCGFLLGSMAGFQTDTQQMCRGTVCFVFPW